MTEFALQGSMMCVKRCLANYYEQITECEPVRDPAHADRDVASAYVREQPISFGVGEVCHLELLMP
jgi:hypothetical protein